MRFIKLLLVGLLFSSSAQAQSDLQPVDFSGRYVFAYAGIPFGALDIHMIHHPDRYKMRSKIHSTGVARLFVQHDSITTSEGTGQDFTYDNANYESNYQTRKKERYVKLLRTDGSVTDEIVKPADNRKIRPAVEGALKNAAHDPLAAVLQVRKELAACLADDCRDFAFTYYDGRRLTELQFTRAGNKTIKIGKTKYITHRLTAKRRLVAGFTQKEMDKAAPDEPPVTLYISSDERLIMLRAEAKIGIGTVSATWSPQQ